MSDNTDEFASNLFNNIDMITEDDKEERWPKCKSWKWFNANFYTLNLKIQLALYGMNNRMGKIKDIDKFDGSFFGLMSQHADEIDIESRILMETTYEAIVDAGESSNLFFNSSFLCFKFIFQFIIFQLKLVV